VAGLMDYKENMMTKPMELIGRYLDIADDIIYGESSADLQEIVTLIRFAYEDELDRIRLGK
jgi:hypothetical protein